MLAPGNLAFAAALAQVHSHCVAFIDSGVAQCWPKLSSELMDAFAALQQTPMAIATTTAHAPTNNSLHHGANSVQTCNPVLSHVEIIPGGEACKDGYTLSLHDALPIDRKSVV